MRFNTIFPISYTIDALLSNNKANDKPNKKRFKSTTKWNCKVHSCTIGFNN